MSVLFIGLGAMGEPMARNLARTVDLTVYDVNLSTARRVAAELAVASVENLETLPVGTDQVVLMVPNSRVVEDLLDDGGGAILSRLGSGGVVIDMSSSEPESTRRLAALAQDRGIDYVDAPVSGGVARAVTGELAIMVGATDAAFARVQSLLQAMGSHLFHVGGPGCGHAAKALNNLLSATNIAAAAEVLTAAVRYGIAAPAMLDVINASTGRSQASEVKYPAHVLTGTFDSGFAMDLMLKDLAIAATITADAGLSTPVTAAAAEIARRARQLTGPRPDHTEIVRFYEASNHVELRA